MCQNLKSEDPGSLQGKTNTAQIPNNKCYWYLMFCSIMVFT